MLSKQVANAILQGIDSLRPLDRRYLLLRYGLGLSYDELAYVSGIAEGNLRVRIARRRSAILRHVRQVLNESLDGANIGKALKTLDLPAAEFPEPDPIASAFLRRRWLGGESLTLEEGQRLEDALAADEGLRLDSVLLRRTGEDQMDDEDVRAHSTTLHIPDAMLVRLLDEARRMGWIA